MKFIHRSVLDKQKWDALVTAQQAAVFSYSWYLDACAIDWCVLVDDDFKQGIALPYNTRFGIRSVYPPMFSRNLDFIGAGPGFREKALPLIVKEFPVGHLQLLEDDEVFRGDAVQRVFQEVTTDPVLNKQAKRMLQKAAKEDITIARTDDWLAVFGIIKSELSEKIAEFNTGNLERLKQLMTALESDKRLVCIGIYMQGKLEGGMVFMETADRRVYLKGAANEVARNAGGMYLGMEQAIRETIENKKAFDFGGSGVEGVRRFNLNLGGTDRHYYIYTWDHAPKWFRMIKKTYQKWKRK